MYEGRWERECSTGILACVVLKATVLINENQHRQECLCYRALRFFSNRSRIRLYSSAQLVGSTKPWFSTGNTASCQFSFPSSISPCTNRTVSRKFTLFPTIPCQIS